jgi:hypothetical protein
MIIELTSIASVVDDETFMVYPLYQDGHYDKGSGFSLEKCFEWVHLLNEWEYKVIQHLSDIKKQKR